MKEMKKITLSLVLIIALLLVPGVILATDDATEVADAKALINAVKSGGTIKLTEDIDLDERLLIDTGVNVVLDLNGNTLDLATEEEWEGNYAATVKGELTIIGNGTVNVNGLYGIGTSTSGGVLTVINGTFNSVSDNVYLIGNYGETVIEGGTFNSNYCAVNGFAAGKTVEIKGGKFTNNDSHPVLGSIAVTAGEFNQLIDGRYLGENADIKIILDRDIQTSSVNENGVDQPSTITLPTGSKVTINLNEHDIFGEQKVIDVKGAELTITGKGTIKETKPNYAPIHITGDSAKETVINVGKDVTLEGWSGIMTSLATDKNLKKLTINFNGTINAKDDQSKWHGHGININGNNKNTENIFINLSSTARIDSTGYGIFAAGYANWNIDGSHIKGEETGIEIRAGKLLIKNDETEIIGNSEEFSCIPDVSGTTTIGAGIAVAQHTTLLDTIVDIEAGTIKGYYALYESNPQGNKQEDINKVSININGGNFETINNGKVVIYSENKKEFIKAGTFNTSVNKDYIPEDCYEQKQTDGTYTILLKTPLKLSGLKVNKVGYNDITLEWNKQNYIDGYQLCYENDKEIKTLNTNSIKLSDLKEGTTYKYKVRAYRTVDGEKYYGEYSSVLTVTTNTRIDISKITVSGISNKTYNGKGLTQNITVKLNGKELKEDTDYKVSYKNNTKPGVATVIITGDGDYKGTVEKTFLITPKKLTGLKVSDKTTSKITLSWTKHEGVTGYKVYSYNSSKKKWEYVGKTDKTSYTIEKLKSSTKYEYRVRAYKNIDGTQYFGSYASSVKTATKPKTPSVKVKAGDKKVTVTWEKVTGASGYRIYMATSKNGEYTRIKTISNNKTFKYTKSGLKTNKKYYFKVRAYKTVDNEKVFSSYTKVLTATTKKVHTVKKGDTLYSIAKKYKTTVAKLTKINKLKKATSVRIGLRLLLN